MPSLYSELTSSEVKQAADKGKIVIIPVGSTEQHGPHLPLDTDISNAFEVSKAAAEEVNALVAPPVYYGISPHWMDYPGTIAVRYDTFIDLVSQICTSLVKHGFKKLVILNGHGGNKAAIDLVAQNVVESNLGRCIIAALSYWDISGEQIDAIRESPYGGMWHACELETSLQLHLRGHLVKMERAVSNIQEKRSEFEPVDMTDTRRGALIYKAGGGGSSLHPSEIGVLGDPTVASKDKGKKFLEAITNQIVKLLRLIDTLEP